MTRPARDCVKAEEETLMLAAREGLLRGDGRAFLAWAKWREAAIRKAARHNLGRSCHGLSGDAVGWLLCPDQVDDLVSAALTAAWRALEGYRYYCTTCRKPSARWGTVAGWSATTFAALRRHCRAEHGVDLEPAQVRPVRERVWYMMGVSMLSVARAEAAKVVRRARIEDLDALGAEWEPIIELERRVSRERRLAELDDRPRLLASLLLSGRSAEDSLRISTMKREEV